MANNKLNYKKSRKKRHYKAKIVLLSDNNSVNNTLENNLLLKDKQERQKIIDKLKKIFIRKTIGIEYDNKIKRHILYIIMSVPNIFNANIKYFNYYTRFIGSYPQIVASTEYIYTKNYKGYPYKNVRNFILKVYYKNNKHKVDNRLRSYFKTEAKKAESILKDNIREFIKRIVKADKQADNLQQFIIKITKASTANFTLLPVIYLNYNSQNNFSIKVVYRISVKAAEEYFKKQKRCGNISQGYIYERDKYVNYPYRINYTKKHTIVKVMLNFDDVEDINNIKINPDFIAEDLEKIARLNKNINLIVKPLEF